MNVTKLRNYRCSPARQALAPVRGEYLLPLSKINIDTICRIQIIENNVGRIDLSHLVRRAGNPFWSAPQSLKNRLGGDFAIK